MFIKSVIALSTCLAISSVAASELKTEQAKLLLQELDANINSTLAKVIKLEKQAGAEKVEIQLDKVSDGSSSIGLLKDPQSGTILSITPDSNAQRIGFKVGDQIISISADQVIIDATKPMSFKSGDKISAVVMRAGEEVKLDGVAAKVQPVSWSLQAQEIVNDSSITVASAPEGCGRVSVFFTPPETKELYPAYVNQIDDDNVMRERQTFKLAAGKHIIELHELIPMREIGRRSGGMQKAKPLEITIEPNKTYYIGAKFFRNKRFNQRKGQYWEPQVWKVSDKSCEL